MAATIEMASVEVDKVQRRAKVVERGWQTQLPEVQLPMEQVVWEELITEILHPRHGLREQVTVAQVRQQLQVQIELAALVVLV
jgi:hypothetical protein